MVKSYKSTKTTKHTSLSGLFSSFDADSTKWYHKIFQTISLTRVILLQVWLVSLSFNPFYQSLMCAITQLFYCLYVIIANPYISPFSKLILLSECLYTGQLITYCIMSIQPEDMRLNYSLALIVLAYLQLLLFVIFSLIALAKIGIFVFDKCVSGNKTANDTE
jgi:hypothetical protein